MRHLSLMIAALALACSEPRKGVSLSSASQAAFDLDADTAQPGYFWELPYPSDLRLDAQGHPQLAAFPNPRGLGFVETFRRIAMERKGFPVVPVGYFRFSKALPPALGGFLIDLEERTRFPVIVEKLKSDDYVPANLVAIAPRPGIVLAPGHRHAFVILRSDDVEPPDALVSLRDGKVPEGALGQRAHELYAPLWAALGDDAARVAAATVFTTGDVVKETSEMSDALLARHDVSFTNLRASGDKSDTACVLRAEVSYPQFQHGAPPFNTQGLFSFDAQGVPEKQRDETAPVMISLPRTRLPSGGYPLAIYFHGSGGASGDLFDHGPTLVPGGEPAIGRGPGVVLNAHGIAMAGSAMPVNPERLPGAAETEYLNFQNLPAMRDTFRQGIIEQRLFIRALKSLHIPAALAQQCPCDQTLCAAPDAGGADFSFDPGKLAGQGQSMGGMYTNLVSAVEPRIRASVPTGAGGFWTYFILVTKLHDGLPELVSALLGAGNPITFMHPALQLIETAWEPADPYVSMPRLAYRPLPGHPARPIYEPVGKDDRYFPTVLYDAVASAYRHQQAGSVVWPSMQESLRLEGLAGLLDYPVANNRTSADGRPYTGVVVQYAGDGIEDPHAIYRQLDAVRAQYGCFLETFFKTGTATVIAPTAACP